MATKRTVWRRYAAIPSGCLAIIILVEGPVSADDEFGFADETADVSAPYFTSNIELGLGYVSDDNGKFGEFAHDLDDQGAFLFGDIQLRGDLADGAQAQLSASKSLYSDRFSLGVGQPEDFSVELYGYDSQKIEMSQAMTLYADSGDSSSLLLPDGFVVNDDTDNLSYYDRRTLGVERRTLGVTFSKHLSPQWLVSIDINRQNKDGEKSAAGSAGFAGTAIVVSPIDYQHDQFTLGLEYNSAHLSMGLSYYLSEFDNLKRSLYYEYPNFNGTDLAGAENALAPDNSFERYELNGTFRLGPRTVLSWLGNWSTAEQNEQFLPYSVNPGSPYWSDGDGVAPLFDSFPVQSLDGQVERFNGRLTLSSRPTRHFNYKLEYAIRNRDADHKPYLWDAVHYNGSITNLDAPSHVYKKDRDTVRLEGGYRFPDYSKLRISWERETIDRSRSELENDAGSIVAVKGSESTEEDIIGADYRFAPIGELLLSLHAEHAERDGDVSEARANHLHTTTIIDVGGTPTAVAIGENTLPFFLADRDSDSLGLQADLPIGQRLAVSAGYTTSEEDYQNSRNFDGVTGRDSDTLNLGLAIVGSEDLQLNIYALIQNYKWQQNGTQSGGNGTVSDLWIAEGKEQTTVVGLNAEWQLIRDKLQLVADLSLSDNDSELLSRGYDPNTAGSAYSDRLPDYGSEVLRIDLRADWYHDKHTSYSLRLLYEDWQTSDFAWKDGELLEDVNGSGGIAFAWQPPDERTTAVMLSMRYAFGAE